MTDKKEPITEKEKELVIARLGVTSPDLHFSDGNNKEAYSRDDIIELIKSGDEVGIDFVRTELEFLRAFKTGELLEQLTKE